MCLRRLSKVYGEACKSSNTQFPSTRDNESYHSLFWLKSLPVSHAIAGREVSCQAQSPTGPCSPHNRLNTSSARTLDKMGLPFSTPARVKVVVA